MTNIKTVVLLMDTIKGFHDIGNLANPRTANIIPNIKKLLMERNEQETKFFLVGDCHDPDDEEFKVFPRHCVEGTEETKIIDELRIPFAKARGLYVRKTRFSGFFDTELESILKTLKPEQVIFTGVSTDICVMLTAVDALMRNYKVIIPRDCVETYDSLPDHPADQYNRWALNHMQMLGATVVDRIE